MPNWTTQLNGYSSKKSAMLCHTETLENNWCQARENLQLVPVKRGKIYNWCQAREYMQLLSKAGKYTTCIMRWKICNCCQKRENVHPVPFAGTTASGAKRGKTCNKFPARKNVLFFLVMGWKK